MVMAYACTNSLLFQCTHHEARAMLWLPPESQPATIERGETTEQGEWYKVHSLPELRQEERRPATRSGLFCSIPVQPVTVAEGVSLSRLGVLQSLLPSSQDNWHWSGHLLQVLELQGWPSCMGRWCSRKLLAIASRVMSLIDPDPGSTLLRIQRLMWKTRYRKQWKDWQLTLSSKTRSM